MEYSIRPAFRLMSADRQFVAGMTAPRVAAAATRSGTPVLVTLPPQITGFVVGLTLTRPVS